MFNSLFDHISNKEKSDAVETLFERSAPSTDFFMMVVLSVLMATFGLLEDSPAVIVGSMLIAPILYPILGIAMGVVMSDSSLVSKSFFTLIKALFLGIMIATLVALLFSSQLVEGVFGGEIISRTQPSLLSAVIGAVAGFAAAFALAKPKLNETLPGVAISVALIPPVAVVGISLAKLNIEMLFSSLLLFLINAVGVIFTAAIVFSLMNFYTKREVAKEVVKEEEKKIEKGIS